MHKGTIFLFMVSGRALLNKAQIKKAPDGYTPELFSLKNYYFLLQQRKLTRNT